MTETFAQLSNNAVYSATVVFTLAMIAHVAEWAVARQLVALPSRSERRALVAAGDTGSPAGVAGSTGAEPPGGTNELDSSRDVERSDRFGRTGFGLTVLGVLVLAVGVVLRGVAADRVPWGNMYEFSITGCLAVGAAYVVLVRRYDIRWLGLLVTGFLVLVLGLAVLVLYRPLSPLVPALHSYWLMIHVSSAAVAGGAFTVGALASVLYLLRRRLEVRALEHPEEPRTGFLWRTPSAEAIDRLGYRVHAFAFPLWTFAVLCGAIWAQYAWGRFWGWDPKEVWAFITWVAYAAYLHARATAGWHGRAAAYVALAGYATFLFNFVGINLFGSGLHSYGGL
ncbi:MAG: c-type cytochrome biogenesis protein CcsB [Nocardioidaceae bacterium]